MSVSLQADSTLPQGYILVDGQRAATISTTGLSATLAANTVTTSALVSGSVTTEKIAPGAITAEKVANGAVIQTQGTSASAYQILTHSTNWGDPKDETTLPVSTAGVQVLSAAITPSSATNKIFVSVMIPTLITAVGYARLILFRNTTAIQADVGYSIDATRLDRAGWNMPTTLTVLDSPNTTSSVIYSVRVARQDAASGTFYLNGNSSGLRGGGVYNPTIILQEIKSS